ncbi:hypothetical protein ACLOJK_011428 [Asimina triloba]
MALQHMIYYAFERSFSSLSQEALNCDKVIPKKRLPSSSSSSSSSMLTSYGSFVIEDILGEITVQESLIVAQSHPAGVSEVLFFGIFEEHTADAATKYMKAHLFDKDRHETLFWKEARETLKILCSSTNDKIQEKGFGVGSAAVVVLNSERFLAVNVGDYRAVLCTSGQAAEICQKRQSTCKMFLSFNGLTGNNRSSEPFVATERITPEMEFIILATGAVWKYTEDRSWVLCKLCTCTMYLCQLDGDDTSVEIEGITGIAIRLVTHDLDGVAMRDQEAVDLIGHIEDADEAAQCIVKETLNRGCKGSISCLVIRLKTEKWKFIH